MAAQVTARMRTAAPEICQQIDVLRTARRAAVDRQYYFKNLGKEKEAAEAQQRLEAIDAKMIPLYAAAKQRLMTGVATDIMQAAQVLQATAADAKTSTDTLAAENERHYAAVSKIVAQQNELGGATKGACDGLDVAAANLIDSDEEVAASTATGATISDAQTAPPTPAATGRSTDALCPHCSHRCKGQKGLASHLRFCKKMPASGTEPPADAAPPSGAEAPANAAPDTMPPPDVTDQVATDANAFVCQICNTAQKSERSLRTHKRHCQKKADAAAAAAATGTLAADAAATEVSSKQVHCPHCNKALKSEPGLKRHLLTCKEKPAPAPVKARSSSTSSASSSSSSSSP